MESVGDVVFFKDMRGEAARALADATVDLGLGGVDDKTGDEPNGEAQGVDGQDEKEDVMVG